MLYLPLEGGSAYLTRTGTESKLSSYEETKIRKKESVRMKETYHRAGACGWEMSSTCSGARALHLPLANWIEYSAITLLPSEARMRTRLG